MRSRLTSKLIFASCVDTSMVRIKDLIPQETDMTVVVFFGVCIISWCPSAYDLICILYIYSKYVPYESAVNGLHYNNEMCDGL